MQIKATLLAIQRANHNGLKRHKIFLMREKCTCIVVGLIKGYQINVAYCGCVIASLYVISRRSCVCVQLSSEMNKLSTWFKTNRLSLNVSKTNCMIFGRPDKPEHHSRPVNLADFRA